ncbi:MAG: glutamate--tRNA ligase [Proteobacteria bacterium]|nr:glutamate--tRNA ligase [Pseudomonadota bacterium]
MSVVVRFAPSPTGHLHVGNARIALVNWLFAQRMGGRFCLRIDDTDPERSEAQYAEAIEEDLAWLGIAWDERIRQSERLGRYAEAFERLRAAERAYACYETPEELAAKRKAQRARGKPPLYDRAGLCLTGEERARLEAEGRRPHWRFLLNDAPVTWDDALRGAVRLKASTMSDPVILRADALPTYTLASVTDDIEMGITHVFRGEDHLSNTAVQVQLFEALGAAPPVFGHLALLAGTHGESLSKRLGSLSLRALRADGIEALALASYLATIGSSDAIEPHISLDELVHEFELAKFSPSPARFDPAELHRLNGKLLHELPFERVADRLRAMGLGDADAAFWETVRANLERLEDAGYWWRVCRSAIEPVIEDEAYLEEAARLLPEGVWDETTWGAWTAKIAEATGRKGRRLYHPLRLALTARERGPELKNLLPVIDRERALARLQGKAA